MKVKFCQSGGYIGLRNGCELDTDLLPPDEIAKLQSLVEHSNILETESAHSQSARDLFNYDITIEINEKVHHTSFDDINIPENIVPLLDYLQSKAKPI
ncbi:MAG: protealysin inhibitor emfourin [Nostoc sp. SerVER01]|nr:hypothetical protein [Nostoc sp. SerVER01]